MRRVMILVAFWVVATAAVAQGDFYKGMTAYKSGDYERAAGEWRPLASQGHVEAQYFLARMYYRGEIGRDDSRAADLYRGAARAGHVMSQNNLGMMYEQGRGVEQDFAEAANWYQRAAQQSLATAQFNIGRLHDIGRGVDQDSRLAVKWYRHAADQGHLKAQIRLALMYDRGQGVPADPGVAANWYREAAKQDHGPSAITLASMYEAGRGVSRNPKKAARWYSRASALGITVRPSSTTAAPTAKTRKKPTKQNAVSPVATSPSKRGVANTAPGRSTPGPPVDAPAVGRPIDSSAVEQPIDSPAVAPQVEQPRSVDPTPIEQPAPPPIEEPSDNLDWEIELDIPEIPELELAELGDPDAQYTLAQRYSTGQGVPRNLKEAGRWYLEAADRGHGLAGYKLAHLYLSGRATSQRNYVLAHKWFSLSAARGIGDSRQWREKIARKMTEEELELSAALVREWKLQE